MDLRWKRMSHCTTSLNDVARSGGSHQFRTRSGPHATDAACVNDGLHLLEGRLRRTSVPQKVDQPGSGSVPESDVQTPERVPHDRGILAVQDADGATKVQSRPIRCVSWHSCLSSGLNPGRARSSSSGGWWTTAGKLHGAAPSSALGPSGGDDSPAGASATGSSAAGARAGG